MNSTLSQTRPVRIGTRGSDLALWQAHYVRDRLQEALPGLQIELEIIRSEGDQNTRHVLYKPSEAGFGLFTKALEEALLEDRIDVAVHSLKDLPTELAPGLALSGVPAREDIHDLWIQKDGRSLETLPDGAIVGTSSLRRRGQARAVRPDVQFLDIRGNVPRRLEILEEGHCAALILAAAGVKRLGISLPHAIALSLDAFLPAPGQGALAIETRHDDAETRRWVSAIHDPVLGHCVTAERTFLANLEGGCQVPIGAYARLEGDQLTLRGMVAAPDGTRVIRGHEAAPYDEKAPQEVAGRLAETFRSQGAEEILREVR